VNATTTAYNAVGSVTYSWAVTQDNLTWQTLTNASALNTTSFTLTLFGTWYVKSTATDSVGDTADAWSEVVVLSGSGNGTGGGGGGGNGTGNSSGAFSVYPVASPQEAPAPANVFFNASVAGGVAPYNFTWAFGDGGTGIGQWQEHVYTNPGTYLARVYVVDGAGVANNTTSLLIIVTGNQTTGNGSGLTFSFSGTPSRGTTPLNVSFKATATGGASPYSLVVCTTLGSCGFSIHNWSGELVTTFGLYTTQGNYTATATLTEANGNQTVATTPILVVAGTPLNVTYLESLSVGPPPLAVGFLATVSGGTGPYSIQWNWGDGTLSSSANGVIVAHAYTTVGVYSPTLAVSDAVGHNVTIRLGTVNVTAGGSPPTGKINGFLPTGGTATLDLEYLGIAAVGALISGIALGGYLQRRDRHREGDTLVRALESTASQSSGTTNEAEGKR
jgi:PKD repeat protein